jgi:DNA polymerase
MSRSDEIAACRPYLNRLVALIQPKLIVTLGRHSLAWFLPEARLSDVHGILQQIGPYAVFPLYHPAAALLVHARRLAFEAAFQHISAILQQMP